MRWSPQGIAGHLKSAKCNEHHSCSALSVNGICLRVRLWEWRPSSSEILTMKAPDSGGAEAAMRTQLCIAARNAVLLSSQNILFLCRRSGGQSAWSSKMPILDMTLCHSKILKALRQGSRTWFFFTSIAIHEKRFNVELRKRQLDHKRWKFDCKMQFIRRLPKVSSSQNLTISPHDWFLRSSSKVSVQILVLHHDIGNTDDSISVSSNSSSTSSEETIKKIPNNSLANISEETIRKPNVVPMAPTAGNYSSEYHLHMPLQPSET